MQTHLSEQTDEIAWVRALPAGPRLPRHLRGARASGPNGLYGHAIHLSRANDRLAEVGAALIHCPTSNTFIGSGFSTWPGSGRGQRVGLATDTGGGSSFSMLRTMAAAYEIAQLKGIALHPAELLWLATGASARALGLETTIGRIAPGFEADLTALDLASTPPSPRRMRGRRISGRRCSIPS
jgi:guanine deaminase